MRAGGVSEHPTERCKNIAHGPRYALTCRFDPLPLVLARANRI